MGVLQVDPRQKNENEMRIIGRKLMLEIAMLLGNVTRRYMRGRGSGSANAIWTERGIETDRSRGNGNESVERGLGNVIEIGLERGITLLAASSNNISMDTVHLPITRFRTANILQDLPPDTRSTSTTATRRRIFLRRLSHQGLLLPWTGVNLGFILLPDLLRLIIITTSRTRGPPPWVPIRKRCQVLQAGQRDLRLLKYTRPSSRGPRDLCKPLHKLMSRPGC
jgi:hypothetical protein